MNVTVRSCVSSELQMVTCLFVLQQCKHDSNFIVACLGKTSQFRSIGRAECCESVVL